MGVVDDAMDELINGFNQPNREVEERANFLADDVIVTDWMAPGKELATTAAEAAEEFYLPMIESFPDVRFEVTMTMRDGNMLLVCGFFNGTMENDHWGLPAHGRKVRWEARDVYRFNDEGLIDRIWFANDTLTVARELGANISDERLW